MRRRTTACLALLALTAAAGTAAATAPVPGLLPTLTAATSPVGSTSSVRAFPVRDAAGAQVGQRSWQVTDAGGNCCETYVVATPSGALAEFGGTLPVVSTDDGASWRKVDPPVPVLLDGGEGAIVVAPDGDLVGVGWDPYGGDHLTTWRYDTATSTWQYGEQPVHSPFFDRQWLTVVPGPITVGLTTVPYAFLMAGGYASLRNVLYLSSDGLHYDELSLAAADNLLGTAAPLGTLPHGAYPAADWTQTPAAFPVTALNGGGALVPVGDGVTPCSLARIVPPSSALRCVSDVPVGTLRQDSRGALVRVRGTGPTALALDLSYDGGGTWATTALPAPYPGSELVGASTTSAGFHTIAVNGQRQMAVVGARVARPQPDGSRPEQDVVYVVDTSGTTPRVAEVLEVGTGGVQTAGGLAVASTTARLDYYTVAITRDGRVATGYLDTTSGGPAVAVETGAGRSY